MSSLKELPVLTFASTKEWESWLAEHHMMADGIWIMFARKGSVIRSLTHPEALESALCYGWIDGQVRSGDGPWWRQRFAPRRPLSKWSKINCAKAEALAAQGRMTAAGFAAMESAKRDGRWDNAYNSPRNITVPPDLQTRLDQDPAARRFFAGLDGRNRYAILYQIHDAKKPATRLRRIEKYVAMLRVQKTLY